MIALVDDAAVPMPERFHTFTLAPLLAPSLRLTLDREQNVLIGVSNGDVVEVQHFTITEIVIVETVLGSYPDYCPHEVLLSAMTGKSVERCRAQINRCLEEMGTVDPVMKPVRNLLGRARLKLHPFGLVMKALPQMGYLLLGMREHERARGVMETGGGDAAE